MVAVLSLTLLGFFLGMRHATDPDHVIAVSTIVTRQPTVRAALLIGSLWGVGHTPHKPDSFRVTWNLARVRFLSGKLNRPFRLKTVMLGIDNPGSQKL